MALILVVDDMPLCRELIGAILKLTGYETACAADGAEALKAIGTRKPDLVILDLAMPGMDGLRFLKRLRANPATTSLPVMLLTAVADKRTVLQAAALGARDYLLKCRFSLAELLQRVKRHVGDPAVRTKPQVRSDSLASAESEVMPGKREVVATHTASSPPSPTSPVAHMAAPDPAGSIATIARLLDRERCLHRAEQAMQAKTLSGVVLQVISMATSPRSDATQMATVIGRDVVLSATVLQVANSAAYSSGRGCISSISEAVRQVGSSTVRNIAAAMGIFEAMPETAPDGFNPIRCWQHSFAVAKLCEHLASMGGGADAGVAYLAGLCHDLGDILFHTHFAAEYAQVLATRASTGLPLDQLERHMLGISHGELAGAILRCLNLPSEILSPIESMHAAMVKNADPHERLARILRNAEFYANGLLLAASGNALLAPLTKAQCKNACKDSDPPRPDHEVFRAEIMGMTGMLARLSRAESDRLMGPLCPKRKFRLWLARDSGLSSFDPIESALELMAEVKTSAALPAAAEAAGMDGLVVVARAANAGGLTRSDITRALHDGFDRPAVPVLWLTATGDAPPTAAASGKVPLDVAGAAKAWPVSIDELALFVSNCGVRAPGSPPQSVASAA